MGSTAQLVWLATQDIIEKLAYAYGELLDPCIWVCGFVLRT